MPTTSPFAFRRSVLLGGAGFVLTGCFDRPCHERNPAQKAFLDGLQELAKPALASNNPLRVEEAARQSVALAGKVGAFSEWCGTLTKIEGNAQTVAVTFDIGRQVSLYAFNDWALGFAGTVTDFFSTRSRAAPPPGLSEQAVAALKTLRLGERVTISGRMGAIAGSGVAVVPDATHGLPYENPRDFNAAVVGFLKGLSAA